MNGRYHNTETPESSFPHLPCEKRGRRPPFKNQEVGPHQIELDGTLILVLPASRTVRDKFALFSNHPVYETLYSSLKELRTKLKNFLNSKSIGKEKKSNVYN